MTLSNYTIEQLIDLQNTALIECDFETANAIETEINTRYENN